MRGLKRLRSVQTISTGHALIQNIRRGHYELAADIDPRLRLTARVHRTRPRYPTHGRRVR